METFQVISGAPSPNQKDTAGYLILSNWIRTSILTPVLVDPPRPEPSVVDEAQDVLLVGGPELQMGVLRDFGS